MMRRLGIIVSLLLFMIACKKPGGDNRPPENGGTGGSHSHVSSPQSITFFSGRNRALISWPHVDTSVTTVKLYWNNAQDSIAAAVVPSMDSVKVLITGLDEGDYNMEIYAFDRAGNRSAKVLKSGHVYGNFYKGPEKKLLNVTYQDDHSLKIDWEIPDNTSVTGAVIFYTDDNGSTQTDFAPRATPQTVLNSVPASNRGTFSYQTIYAPSGRTIDTLFTAVASASYINRRAVFDSLPGWKFRCQVKAEAQTISDFGGMIDFKEKMDEALFKASKKFQLPGLNDAGNHEIHFYMTEISSFTGTSGQFRYVRGVDDPSVDVMIIVNAHAAKDDLSWGWLGEPYLTLGHDYAGLFVPNAIDALTHEFGHSRGMYDLYLEQVNKAADNPISGQTYKAKDGIMNAPYGNDKWADLTKFIINESADKKVSVKYWNYFPASFQIMVEKDGVPLQGARIKLFPVGYGTSANKVRENDVIMYRGTTDASGRYGFDNKNPFAIDQDPSRVVFNFLVQVEYDGNFTYGWMPLDEALLAGSQGKPYSLMIKIQ